MLKFLLDANLSPITASHLRKLGFNTKSITEEKLGYLIDEEVIKLAQKESRIIITFDLDFGEIYHSRESGKIGVIVLRIENQTSKNVNFVLEEFILKNMDKLNKNKTSLVVIKRGNVRLIQ